jgi:hypothetical protein
MLLHRNAQVRAHRMTRLPLIVFDVNETLLDLQRWGRRSSASVAPSETSALASPILSCIPLTATFRIGRVDRQCTMHSLSSFEDLALIGGDCDGVATAGSHRRRRLSSSRSALVGPARQSGWYIVETSPHRAYHIARNLWCARGACRIAGQRPAEFPLYVMWPALPTPALRQGTPQTHCRNCGSQSAHQSLITDVYRPCLLPLRAPLRDRRNSSGRKSAPRLLKSDIRTYDFVQIVW